jgi:ribosomal protein S6--L-glutamate ligase
VNRPEDVPTLEIAEVKRSFFLAQRYVENKGFDIKLYVIGRDVYSVAKKSPLHPELEVKKHMVPITLELRKLALQVGEVFGLDIYGLDVVETDKGWVVVDVNDFPSFGLVPRAVILVSSYILHIAKNPELQRRPMVFERVRQRIAPSEALS